MLGAAGFLILVVLSIAGYAGPASSPPADVLARGPSGCPPLPRDDTTPKAHRVDEVVPRATAPTIVDHAPPVPDVAGILTDAREVLGGFEVLERLTLPSSGMVIEVRSDGPLLIDPAALDRLARLPLDRSRRFSDLRISALLDCYHERVLEDRELADSTLRIYVPSDHTTCYQEGRLTRVGGDTYATSCDAAGFTLPGVPLRVKLLGAEVARISSKPSIIVSGAARDRAVADVRLAYHLLHEFVHHYDNALGLRPWTGPLAHYEQRAYYIERTLRAQLTALGGPPLAIRYPVD
ncbi:MAG: hypothetical protein R3320_08805 [Nitriliruptorales bacterium]|nr:hypothetical protein [Nitriliruptorales bacterium]